MRRTRLLVSILTTAALAVAGCEGDTPTVPRAKNLVLEVLSGDEQFALPGGDVEDPLVVRLAHVYTGRPVANVEVVWSVVSGDGATIATQYGVTDAGGRATTSLRVGAGVGEYAVQSTFDGLWGAPPRFMAYATHRPEIDEISPVSARAGDTVTISGRNFFSAQPDWNLIRIGGRRAEVLSATDTELRAVVPGCLPTRTVMVTTALGPIESEGLAIHVDGVETPPVAIAAGSALRLTGAESDACVRLPVQPAGSSYLFIPQSLAESGGALPFQLVGVSDAGEVAAAYTLADMLPPRPSAAGALQAWLHGQEIALIEALRRRGERPALPPGMMPSITPNVAPPLGHTRSFGSLDAAFSPVTVSATLRAVGERVLIYQDVAAPQGGFTTADFEHLAQMFDDPIFGAVSDVFGEVSDVDGNGRVIVLLTPTVNSMTPAHEAHLGFIAGFFVQCDLIPGLILGCPGNGGEIFYSLVPDPAGEFGIAHQTENMLPTILPVLAHELQHMIHFHERTLKRNAFWDALWVREALAHSAEELVADAFRARGNESMAVTFERQNHIRAAFYLRNPGSASLVATTGLATLEERGAGWLFLTYLRGRFGVDVLRRLTHGTLDGMRNVDAATGADWRQLLSDWGVALYADDSPELAGLQVDSRFAFPHLNLHESVRLISGDSTIFALRPHRPGSGDFQLDGGLQAAGSAFVIVDEDGLAQNIALAGRRGAAFPAGAPRQVTIFRLR